MRAALIILLSVCISSGKAADECDSQICDSSEISMDYDSGEPIFFQDGHYFTPKARLRVLFWNLNHSSAAKNLYSLHRAMEALISTLEEHLITPDIVILSGVSDKLTATATNELLTYTDPWFKVSDHSEYQPSSNERYNRILSYSGLIILNRAGFNSDEIRTSQADCLRARPQSWKTGTESYESFVPGCRLSTKVYSDGVDWNIHIFSVSNWESLKKFHCPKKMRTCSETGNWNDSKALQTISVFFENLNRINNNFFPENPSVFAGFTSFDIKDDKKCLQRMKAIINTDVKVGKGDGSYGNYNFIRNEYARLLKSKFNIHNDDNEESMLFDYLMADRREPSLTSNSKGQFTIPVYFRAPSGKMNAPSPFHPVYREFKYTLPIPGN